MANQIVIALPRVTDANGDAVSGAKAYFYEKGTTTPVTVYSDEALSVPHASPLVADSGGVFAQVFHDGATEVKAVVQDADDAALYTLDPAPLSTGVASAAENVTVAPFTGVVATNVQDALEEVQGNITAVGANVQTLVQTGGSSNAYTLNAAETITAYAAGQRFVIRPNHSNTGAATLNVDGLGAKDIKIYNAAGSLVDPAAGDLGINRICEVTYDGTRFVIITTTTGYIQEYARLRLATKQATTSGPTVTFSSIPAGVREVQIMFNGVSTGGADDFLIQLGDSGGIESSGYTSSSGGTGSTSGFIVKRSSSSTVTSGIMSLTLLDAATFTWASSHAVGAGGENYSGGGAKALSAELTQIQIGMTGSNNFDAGEISIAYR